MALREITFFFFLSFLVVLIIEFGNLASEAETLNPMIQLAATGRCLTNSGAIRKLFLLSSFRSTISGERGLENLRFLTKLTVKC